MDFPLSEYQRMADLMARLKWKAILSLNDRPDIRRVVARFQRDATGIKYTVGGGGHGDRAAGAQQCRMVAGFEEDVEIAWYDWKC